MSKNHYLPNNIYASPSLDKETRLIEKSDGNGEKKQRKDNSKPAFKWKGDLPFMRKNRDKIAIFA
ncbi:hypothetical protein [Neobacillus cucumis]|uniref:hypothetical protein n=1 Tax=Neobacillus cucumis TaxID=1740721 RepID=UPI0019635290|nr:hypothetical protein [Neobacillus cucumis]MED4224005.1 hypothetical protein [Neobacillus cucumis]